MEFAVQIGRALNLLFLGACAVRDVRYGRIPWTLLAIGAGLGMAYTVFFRHSLPELLAAVLPGVFLIITAFLTKEQIGYGDGICCAVSGLFVGAVYEERLMVSGIIFAAGYALLLLSARQKSGSGSHRAGEKRREIRFAFIPFLVAGVIAAELMPLQ